MVLPGLIGAEFYAVLRPGGDAKPLGSATVKAPEIDGLGWLPGLAVA